MRASRLKRRRGRLDLRVPKPLKPAAYVARDGLFRLLRAPTPPIGMDLALAGLAQRGFSPTSVLDVGAAVGMWTRLALKHWPDAEYTLLEPLRERRSELAALAAENAKVRYVLVAAGPAPAVRTLNLTADLFGSSFLYPGVETREVAVIAVDDLINQGALRPPDLIKVDVQGYELDVLAGAQEALRTCELIVMEARIFRGGPGMPMLHEAIDWMVARGFRPYEIADVLRRPRDGAMAQCDVIFAREGSSLLAFDAWA